MRGKWILLGGLLVLASIVGAAISLKREKSLAIEAAKMHLAQMVPSVSSARVKRTITYAIKDVDNYGRNWTIWAQDAGGNAVAINVYSSRGIGPVPFFNTPDSLIITEVEAPVTAK